MFWLSYWIRISIQWFCLCWCEMLCWKINHVMDYVSASVEFHACTLKFNKIHKQYQTGFCFLIRSHLIAILTIFTIYPTASGYYSTYVLICRYINIWSLSNCQLPILKLFNQQHFANFKDSEKNTNYR